jgi:opacity protein-like surface antigen
MASKKYTLILAMLVMLQIAGNAQTKTDWGWDWKDSSKVPTKSIPQYNEFLNNQFPFPPKPRNAWELGFTLGNSVVIGDIPLSSKNTGGYVIGASLRKSISHLLSLRGSLYFSQSSIPAIAGKSPFVKTTMVTGSLDAIFSINALSFYRGNPKFDWYGLAGSSLISLSAKDKAGNSLKLPGSNTLSKSGNNVFVPTINLGAGVAYKINSKINIGVEEKFFVPSYGYDYLDGYKPAGYSAPDILAFTTVRLNINLGN